jgi:hypothetical protein
MRNNLQKPNNIIGEINTSLRVELEKHFVRISNKVWCFERHIFALVINGNKTLISLIAGAVTGFSINILTGFLNYSDYDCIKRIHVSVILILAFVLNIAVILFAKKVAQIQGARLNFEQPEGMQLLLKDIRTGEYNLIYAECYKNIRYLKAAYIISVLFLVLTVVALIVGRGIIAEVVKWRNCR